MHLSDPECRIETLFHRNESAETHPDARSFFTKASSSFLRNAYPLSDDSTISGVAGCCIMAILTLNK